MPKKTDKKKQNKQRKGKNDDCSCVYSITLDLKDVEYIRAARAWAWVKSRDTMNMNKRKKEVKRRPRNENLVEVIFFPLFSTFHFIQLHFLCAIPLHFMRRNIMHTECDDHEQCNNLRSECKNAQATHILTAFHTRFVDGFFFIVMRYLAISYFDNAKFGENKNRFGWSSEKLGIFGKLDNVAHSKEWNFIRKLYGFVNMFEELKWAHYNYMIEKNFFICSSLDFRRYFIPTIIKMCLF